MTIDLPPARGSITRSSFGLYTNTQSFTSPLTRATQTLLLGGARWQANYTIRRMHAREAGTWLAFFLSLEGMAGRFNAYDPDHTASRGTALGNPAVNGAGQTGSSLVIDGLAANQLAAFVAGDMFSVNGELKMLIRNAPSDSGGNATLYFKPALRYSPADNAQLTFTRPTCTMMLSGDDQAIWESDARGVYEEKSFSAVEAFA